MATGAGARPTAPLHYVLSLPPVDRLLSSIYVEPIFSALEAAGAPAESGRSPCRVSGIIFITVNLTNHLNLFQIRSDPTFKE